LEFIFFFCSKLKRNTNGKGKGQGKGKGTATKFCHKRMGKVGEERKGEKDDQLHSDVGFEWAMLRLG